MNFKISTEYTKSCKLTIKAYFTQSFSDRRSLIGMLNFLERRH